jgi:hypothetical protein
MAVAAGILPWSAADTDAGIIACAGRWVRQRGNTDAAGELLQEIGHRRRMFAATIDDRLIRLSRDGRGRLLPASALDRNKMAAAARGEVAFDGFVKDERILLTPDAWHRLWTGLDAAAVKDHLLRTQLLISGAGGDIPSLEKVESGARPHRFYVLAPDFSLAS